MDVMNWDVKMTTDDDTGAPIASIHMTGRYFREEWASLSPEDARELAMDILAALDAGVA